MSERQGFADALRNLLAAYADVALPIQFAEIEIQVAALKSRHRERHASTAPMVPGRAVCEPLSECERQAVLSALLDRLALLPGAPPLNLWRALTRIEGTDTKITVSRAYPSAAAIADAMRSNTLPPTEKDENHGR